MVKNPKRTISCDQKSKKELTHRSHKTKKISTFFLNNLTCIFMSPKRVFYPFTFVSLPLYYQYKRLLIFFTSSSSQKIYTRNGARSQSTLLSHTKLLSTSSFLIKRDILRISSYCTLQALRAVLSQ